MDADFKNDNAFFIYIPPKESMCNGTNSFVLCIRMCYRGDRMNKARKFLMDAAGHLDLPADILAAVPKMEVIGFREFSVEPHKGLLEYEKAQIGIETNMGRIRIVGSDLTIKLMNRNRITISGELHSVCLRED